MPSASAVDRIGEYVRVHRASFDTPGLALAVTDPERTMGVLVDGSANLDAGTPIIPSHRFEIGSIGKGFTAMAVLRQVERGRLDLDAPLEEYLPWFDVRSPFPPITVHHLLSHTSGLICGMEFTGEAARELWAARELTLTYPPGERFVYSNLGYKALGLVLERVAGRPWWESVREDVVEPAGLADLDLVITHEVRDRLAVGYAPRFDDRPWQPRHGWVPAPWFESATADGTICATAEGLGGYARLLLNRGAGVLSGASFERMAAPVAEDPEAPGQRYGYGVKWLDRDGRRLLGHSGGMVGYAAYALADPEAGVGAVVLMNASTGWRLDLVTFVVDCARAEVSGAALPDVPEPRDPRRVEDAGAFAGVYASPSGRSVEIAVEGDRLELVDGGRRAGLVPTFDDRFLVDHPDPDLERYVLRFQRDGGAVTRVVHGPRWFSRERTPSAEPPEEAEVVAGHYRSWNPWAPSFRVYLCAGALWLDLPGDASDVAGEFALTRLPDGSYRVGGGWRPDRIRFDGVVDGQATRARWNGAPFHRTFTP